MSSEKQVFEGLVDDVLNEIGEEVDEAIAHWATGVVMALLFSNVDYEFSVDMNDEHSKTLFENSSVKVVIDDDNSNLTVIILDTEGK